MSRTYTDILAIHGKPATRMEFENLLSNSTFKKNRPRILVGGVGAWQLLNPKLRCALGIDTLILGQAEHSIVDVFRKAVNGEKLEGINEAETPEICENSNAR